MTRKKIIYIAGPMTGLAGFNLSSFNRAAAALVRAGFEVRNPACLGHGWANYEHYMEIDRVMLGQCDHIVFLPGSHNSPGALREKAFAEANGITPVVTPPGLLHDLEKEFAANGGVLWTI
jgi:predicted Rossmann-fold nucleotide-binding protein